MEKSLSINEDQFVYMVKGEVNAAPWNGEMLGAFSSLRKAFDYCRDFMRSSLQDIRDQKHNAYGKEEQSQSTFDIDRLTQHKGQLIDSGLRIYRCKLDSRSGWQSKMLPVYMYVTFVCFQARMVGLDCAVDLTDPQNFVGMKKAHNLIAINQVWGGAMWSDSHQKQHCYC